MGSLDSVFNHPYDTPTLGDFTLELLVDRNHENSNSVFELLTVSVGAEVQKNRQSWVGNAACVGELGVFFSDEELDINKAKEICNGCRVKDECLQEALESAEHGIRGGLTEEERFIQFGVKPLNISSNFSRRVNKLLLK